MKQAKVLCKVGREAPKQAKEKFWRVVIATTIGCKMVASIINDATDGYCEGTNEEIRRQIEEWEPSQNYQTSMIDIEMQDWEAMVPDLVNTHRPVTLFK